MIGLGEVKFLVGTGRLELGRVSDVEGDGKATVVGTCGRRGWVQS